MSNEGPKFKFHCHPSKKFHVARLSIWNVCMWASIYEVVVQFNNIEITNGDSFFNYSSLIFLFSSAMTKKKIIICWNKVVESCRWSLIAGRIPGRSAEEIEKYWKSRHTNSNIESKTETWLRWCIEFQWTLLSLLFPTIFIFLLMFNIYSLPG